MIRSRLFRTGTVSSRTLFAEYRRFYAAACRRWRRGERSGFFREGSCIFLLFGLQDSGCDAAYRRDRDLVLSGRVRPLLAATYPLEDIARAQAGFMGKDFIGKLVITTGRSR